MKWKTWLHYGLKVTVRLIARGGGEKTAEGKIIEEVNRFTKDSNKGSYFGFGIKIKGCLKIQCWEELMEDNAPNWLDWLNMGTLLIS